MGVRFTSMSRHRQLDRLRPKGAKGQNRSRGRRLRRAAGAMRGLRCGQTDLTEETATLPKTGASADQRGAEPVTLMYHRRQNDLQLRPEGATRLHWHRRIRMMKSAQSEMRRFS